MEVILPTQAHETSIIDIVNDIVEHVVDNANVFENDVVDIALGIRNDQLTLPRQVTPPSGLAEAMINLNEHSVSRTNEQRMNMPSQPGEL